MVYVGNSIIVRAWRNLHGHTVIDTNFQLVKGTITNLHFYGPIAGGSSKPRNTFLVKVFRDLGDGNWTFIDESLIFVIGNYIPGAYTFSLDTPIDCENGDFLGIFFFNGAAPDDAIPQVDYDGSGSATAYYKAENISTTKLKTYWDSFIMTLSVGADITPPPVPSALGNYFFQGAPP